MEPFITLNLLLCCNHGSLLFGTPIPTPFSHSLHSFFKETSHSYYQWHTRQLYKRFSLGWHWIPTRIQLINANTVAYPKWWMNVASYWSTRGRAYNGFKRTSWEHWKLSGHCEFLFSNYSLKIFTALFVVPAWENPFPSASISFTCIGVANWLQWS